MFFFCFFLPPPHTIPVELSKLAVLNDSAGGYDWVWQKEARALQEKAQAAEGAEAAEEDRDAKAALKLSMDNILMVSRVESPVFLHSSFCKR